MTRQQYAKYEAAVAYNLKGLEFVSTGACPGCDECGLSDNPSDHDRECADEGGFSWRECEACGSSLGGNRYPAHARTKDGALLHFEVCEDCLMYLNYGQLDDMSMMEMESETAE